VKGRRASAARQAKVSGRVKRAMRNKRRTRPAASAPLSDERDDVRLSMAEARRRVGELATAMNEVALAELAQDAARERSATALTMLDIVVEGLRDLVDD